MKHNQFQVTFWGVRGSYPQCGGEYVRVGGHTSCVGVEVGNRYFLLDAGTGIVNAGNDVIQKGIKEVTLFISHPHADHISGFAFFKPLHVADFHLSIIAGRPLAGHRGSIQAVLGHIISPPYFPLQWDKIACRKTCRDVTSGVSFSLGTVKISTIPLNHPGGSCGYRIECDGKSICYITDMAPLFLGTPDSMLTNFVRDTNLLIYDSMFTEAEFACRPDWGHSTWNQAIQLAKAASVDRLALFHHNPDHNDDFMDTLEQQARVEFPKAFVARQNMKWIA
jgi:phosphoribosyl 1,2-cyclic phosphodiesterase